MRGPPIAVEQDFSARKRQYGKQHELGLPGQLVFSHASSYPVPAPCKKRVATADDQSSFPASQESAGARGRFARPADLQSRRKQERFGMRLFPMISGQGRALLAQ